MKRIDWQESKIVKEAVDAQVGECVANNVRAFLRSRHLILRNAEYVEGLWLIGGQLGIHAWIETPNSIIDPTLLCWKNASLRNSAKHYAIQSLSGDEVIEKYKDQSIEAGGVLQVDLSWADPRVEKLSHEVDPP